MRIVDLADHRQLIEQVAEMLFEGFRDRWPDAWPDLEAATAEVQESLGEGRISLVAVDADIAIGWIGAIRSYSNAWELHPLVVAGARRGEGIGTRLVEALQDRIAGIGGRDALSGDRRSGRVDDPVGGRSLPGPAGAPLADRGRSPLPVLPETRILPGRDHPRCQWTRSTGHPHGETDRQSPEAG